MWQGPIWFNIARLVLYIIIPGIQQGITTRWFLNILSCANNCCLSLLGFGTGKWRVTRLEPSAAVGALTVLDVAALAFNREWVKSRFVVKVSLLFFALFCLYWLCLMIIWYIRYYSLRGLAGGFWPGTAAFNDFSSNRTSKMRNPEYNLQTLAVQ